MTLGIAANLINMTMVYGYIFFFKIFFDEYIFKVFLNLLQYCFCFMFWGFGPGGM